MIDHVAEEATGCRQAGPHLGIYYADEETQLLPRDAYEHLKKGQRVEVPAAGAGSYGDFFYSLGMKAETVETSSSAGDWTLAAQDGAGGYWYVAWQTNRHPYHGFSYRVDFRRSFVTKEGVERWLASIG